jgi:hypothetical protein
MLFSVPDSLVCGPAAGGNEQAGCHAGQFSTSHYNEAFDNHMGITPAGRADPNGTDFWWDEFVGSRGNCWYRNLGPKPITSSPAGLPDCDDGKDPAASVGKGNPQNEGELISCVAAFETRNFEPGGPCPWLTPPSEPSGGDSGPSRSPFLPIATASAGPVPASPARNPVPLGQASCTDWNRAGEPGRLELVERVRAFAGGVVNTGEANIGTGAVLANADAHGLFDGWCARAYAQGFLLYKLYTHAAAFAHRR